MAQHLGKPRRPVAQARDEYTAIFVTRPVGRYLIDGCRRVSVAYRPGHHRGYDKAPRGRGRPRKSDPIVIRCHVESVRHGRYEYRAKPEKLEYAVNRTANRYDISRATVYRHLRETKHVPIILGNTIHE